MWTTFQKSFHQQFRQEIFSVSRPGQIHCSVMLHHLTWILMNDLTLTYY